MLGLSSNAAGVITGAHISVMKPSENRPFWEFARVLKKEMLVALTREPVLQAFHMIREMVEQEGDPGDTSTMKNRKQLMISNYGDRGVRTIFGDLTLKSLYPSVLSGDGETQTISAVTLNGALHITHISRQPFPSLMDDALSMVMEACPRAVAAA